jgi:hypothetical protein
MILAFPITGIRILAYQAMDDTVVAFGGLENLDVLVTVVTFGEREQGIQLLSVVEIIHQ